MGGIFYAYGLEGVWVGTRCMGGLTKSVICKLSYDLNFATQPSMAVRDTKGPYAKLYLILYIKG